MARHFMIEIDEETLLFFVGVVTSTPHTPTYILRSLFTLCACNVYLLM